MRLLKARYFHFCQKNKIIIRHEAIEFFIELNQLLIEFCKASLVDLEFQSYKASFLTAGNLTNSLILIIDLAKEINGQQRFIKTRGEQLHKLWEEILHSLFDEESQETVDFI